MSTRADPSSNAGIAERLARVHERIAAAARQAQRDPESIQLVAVSKTKPTALLAQAMDAGQLHFGENYLQDALPKIEALAHRKPLWHFIGGIQSNKSRDIAAHFDWAHAVDRYKIARRLSEQRPEGLAPLNVCIQVNIDDEASKEGLAPEAAFELAEQMAQLEGIRLRGLMTVPAPAEGYDAQRRAFAALGALYARLKAEGHALDTLSIGMSADLEAAVAEGATHLRIGSAIFGARG